jgi:hypothetical protein
MEMPGTLAAMSSTEVMPWAQLVAADGGHADRGFLHRGVALFGGHDDFLEAASRVGGRAHGGGGEAGRGKCSAADHDRKQVDGS